MPRSTDKAFDQASPDDGGASSLNPEEVSQALARTHDRLLAEIASGERDARSLMLIPDSMVGGEVEFPPDAFGPADEW